MPPEELEERRSPRVRRRACRRRDEVDPLVRVAVARPAERVDERVRPGHRAHLERAVGVRRLAQNDELLGRRELGVVLRLVSSATRSEIRSSCASMLRRIVRAPRPSPLALLETEQVVARSTELLPCDLLLED